MFRIILVLLLLLPANVFAYECTREIDNLSKENNVKITCKLSLEKMLREEIDGQEPEGIELKKFFPILKDFMRDYDNSFLKKNLNEIILLKKLIYRNNEVGGLSDGKKIFINLIERGSDYYDIYLRNLHHEFSSNILRISSYNIRSEWEKISRFNYDNSSFYFRKCINDAQFAKDSSQKINEEGFIVNYGRTNTENDFNTFVEYLFAQPNKINSLKKYEKINLKISILKEMYRNAGYIGKFPDET